MKRLCCNKYIFLLVFFYSSLFGALTDKSAIVYYGDDISYPMVGIHDYIIVQPEKINTHTHGFSLYKNKMYAYVSVGEINANIKEYSKIKKDWILGENKAWKSIVVDLTNPEYQDFLFQEMIEPQMKKGFKNFFFDTLDSYQIIAKTDAQRMKHQRALSYIINKFHKRYPDSKLIINRGFEVIDAVHDSLEAVLFESYYYGVGGKDLSYKKVSDADRKWLNIHLDKIKSYGLNIIALDYLALEDMNKAEIAIKEIQAKGMIPYIATVDLNTYGKSSKNSIKREILTLIDESSMDRMFMGAHRLAAPPLEYMGYIQKLYDINSKELPKIDEMTQYAGVIVWLRHYYKNSHEFMQWIKKLIALDIKVVFMDNLGLDASDKLLNELGISVIESINDNTNNTIVTKDKSIGFEMDPPLSNDINIEVTNAEKLLTYKKNGIESTTVAITKWGGYAYGDSFITTLDKEEIWIVDPFAFFVKSLRLKKIIVPDVTTGYGKRLLFSHIDGDGIMSKVEWDSKLLSGDTILEEILKKYSIPHSVSVIGGEINNEGLYPEIAPRLQNIARDMYKLDNVEASTHTYTHPFYWGKIIDDDLGLEYRLKVKNYEFSLDREIKGSLQEINTKLLSDEKVRANSIFWTGDCAPTEIVLANIYKNKILNINGGDTYISNRHPWLSYIAPLGVQRGDYYQVYAGAQNENVFTNDWLGPFWGFKTVVQTFKLTNSPRRFKPIDIYYHMYSGSKKASLNALRYVFDWAIKEDVMPIFTSEYIPKVMDFYTVSIASEDKEWLVDGMKNLKTLRIEEKNAKVNLNKSQALLGFNHFENHTYIHVSNDMKCIVSEASKDFSNNKPYLISSNAKVIDKSSKNKGLHLKLKGHVDLKFQLYVPSTCRVKYSHKAKSIKSSNNITVIEYKNIQEVDVDVICK